jgi:hypothetical protein
MLIQSLKPARVLSTGFGVSEYNETMVFHNQLGWIIVRDEKRVHRQFRAACTLRRLRFERDPDPNRTAAWLRAERSMYAFLGRLGL